VTKSDHQASAEHHIRMGKLHKSALSALKKARGMSDEDEEEGETGGDPSMDSFEKFHKGAMAEHAEMASHHLEMCKTATADFSKSEGMDRDGIRPDSISLLAPEIPQHIRAVPRAGQREIGKAIDVDASLAKVIGTDELE
jgi:hypothetical protein